MGLDAFLLLRAFALFWCAVQQVCFIWLKRSYCAASGRTVGGSFYAVQAALIAAVLVASFLPELGIVLPLELEWTAGALAIEPAKTVWVVTACAAMICFDALLVLYARRFLVLCRTGEARGRSLGDALVIAASFGAAALYIAASNAAAVELRAGPAEYLALRRAFIQAANVCYAVLEITGAFVLYGLWREMRLARIDEGGRKP